VFGPEIDSGKIERTISIMDFAPTFLSIFGLTNPNLDGKPIDEIFGKEGYFKFKSAESLPREPEQR
jgi:predicted AlkP superfamily phosphohydrolase/phosphomutase